MIHCKLPVTILVGLFACTLVLYPAPALTYAPALDGEASRLFDAASLEQVKLVPNAVKAPAFAKRSRVVTVNLAVLAASMAKDGALAEPARVPLNLFDGITLTAIISRSESLTGGTKLLYGAVQDRPSSSVFILIRKDLLVASIRTPKEGLFRIRPVSDAGKLHVIQQIDENEFPPCGVTPRQVLRGADVKSDHKPHESKRDDGSRFDVLVGYTGAAKSGAGDQNSIEMTVQLAVEETNQAYQLSGVNPRLRLVRTIEVSYTESTNWEGMLNHLTGKSDGQMDSIHALRDEHRADLVSLIVEDRTYCGMAWLMTSLSADFESHAFSLVSRTCATGYYSFGHELGHNMGCCHDRGNHSGPSLYPYSFGWRFDAGGNTYRTILAYAPGTRIQRFSNPDVSYLSVPTGVPIGQADAACNACSINNAASVIANWRQE